MTTNQIELPKNWQLQPYEGSALGKNQFTQNRIARVARRDQVRQLCVSALAPFDGGKKRRVQLVILRGDYPAILTGEKTRFVECATGDEARAVRELLKEAPAM